MKCLSYYDVTHEVWAIVRPTKEGLEYHGSFEKWQEAVTPEGVTYAVLDDSNIPESRIFRNAWHLSTGKNRAELVTDVVKAKDIAHTIRRDIRAVEFKPLDAIATVPGKIEEVENARQDVRDKYAQIQIDIDSCETEAQLLEIVAQLTKG